MIEVSPIVDWHLRNWQRWMRVTNLGLSYPSRSAGLESGGVSSADAFDLLCEDADEQAAVALNAIIDSLAPDETAAINHQYLHAVYRMRDFQGSLDRALAKVWRGMLARGIA